MGAGGTVIPKGDFSEGVCDRRAIPPEITLPNNLSITSATKQGQAAEGYLRRRTSTPNPPRPSSSSVAGSGTV